MDDVSLLYHFEKLMERWEKQYDQRLEAFETVVREIFKAAEMALEKAEVAMSTRLEHMNGMQQKMDQQAGQMVNKTELSYVTDQLRKLEETVHEIRRSAAKFNGQWLVLSGLAGACASIITALLVWWITKS